MSIFDTGSNEEIERLTQENASLQARLDLISDTIKEERARQDSRGRGGQQAGDNSARMTVTMLHEFERLIEEGQGKYTYECYLKMQDRITDLENFVKHIRDDWSCDLANHESGIPCRRCRAAAMLINEKRRLW